MLWQFKLRLQFQFGDSSAPTQETCEDYVEHL